ncbi:carbon-nitrogen hydrolase family protein [Candidatus Hydrogenedentota bacterium]
MNFNFAMCQVETKAWDAEGNLKRAYASIEKAAELAADLCCLPECVLSGYPTVKTTEEIERLTLIAEKLGGPIHQKLMGMAKSLGIDVIFGYPELGDDGKLYNSCVYIRKDGSIKANYRKVHLRDFEVAGGFVPGDEFPVVEVELGGETVRVGLMICFDRELVESSRCLRAQGAEFIAVPLATDTYPLNRPIDTMQNEMLTRTRAAENEVFMAVVNHAGRFNGGSFVVGPKGEVLASMNVEAGVEVVRVPIHVLREEYHSKPLGWMGWGYRRPELYEKYLGPGSDKS